MMTVNLNPKFKAQVTVYEPADGGKKEGRFTAQFRVLSRTELEAHDFTTTIGTAAFLRDVIIGWVDIVDEEKRSFEFSDANLQALLDFDHYRSAFSRAYFDATNGQAAARRGN